MQKLKTCRVLWSIHVVLFDLVIIELSGLSELFELFKLDYGKTGLINIFQILTIFNLIYINIIYKFSTIVILF